MSHSDNGSPPDREEEGGAGDQGIWKYRWRRIQLRMGGLKNPEGGGVFASLWISEERTVWICDPWDSLVSQSQSEFSLTLDSHISRSSSIPWKKRAATGRDGLDFGQCFFYIKFWTILIKETKAQPVKSFLYHLLLAGHDGLGKKLDCVPSIY